MSAVGPHWCTIIIFYVQVSTFIVDLSLTVSMESSREQFVEHEIVIQVIWTRNIGYFTTKCFILVTFVKAGLLTSADTLSFPSTKANDLKSVHLGTPI